MKNNALKIIVFCLITLSSFNSIAQPGVEDASGTGNLEGTDTAPISDYIIPMLLIGIVIGYRLLKHKKQLAK
jgi:hypothetical protein